MLNSIEIRNYKNLKQLKLNSLGRVNLITGKNNTGKSTLLEAISLYSSKADISWIYQILDERGEFIKSRDNSKGVIENNVKSFSSLFNERKIAFSHADSVFIETEKEEHSLARKLSPNDSVQLRFVRYIDETINQIERENEERIIRSRKRIILDENIDDKIFDSQIGLEMRSGGQSYILPLDSNIKNLNRLTVKGLGESENFQFIKTKNIDREVNAKLWDDIALTRKEAFVVKALRIIEPNLERIAFVSEDDYPRRRTPVIKLQNSEEVVPLKGMGDGINRILTIILGLVNSDGGYFLIDEFENGLHYSVQENLWSMVFELSVLLDIQIFATTHSFDCIVSFYNTLKKQNSFAGKLIRLESINGSISIVDFNEDELRIATENYIETR
jgi:AAA15 family ATPase/GTPase